MQITKPNVTWLAPLLLIASAIGISWDASVNMVMLWLGTDTYMHGMFVLPLAFFMAKQKPWPQCEIKPVPLYVSLALSLTWGAGMLLGILSMINVIQQAMLFSLIPMWVLSVYGWRVAWHYRAPLLLIFLAVPVGDFMIPYLQSVTADMAVAMLQWTGVSVVRNGWYISIPAADFRVAEACSGINFLISTFTVAIFYAFTYMNKTGKRVAFIIMGLVVPVLANGLRVYLIIMIAHWGNVEAATGFDHLVYGWIFFVVILVALFTLGHFWQDPLADTEEVSANKLPEHKLTTSALGLFVGVAGVVFVVILSHLRMAEAERFEPVGIVVEKGDILGPDFPEADSVSRQSVNGDVYFYTIYYGVESAHMKIISYQNRWFNGKVWSLDRLTSVSQGDTVLIESHLVDLSGREYIKFHGYCIGGEWAYKKIDVKIQQAWSRLTGADFGGKAYAWFGPRKDRGSVLPTQETLQALCHR